MFQFSEDLSLPNSLPFSVATDWLNEARALWRDNFGFFTSAGLVILIFRWMLDFGARGSAIFLSYFTDALLFSAAFIGLSASLAGEIPRPSLIQGWRRLAGRKKKILLTGLLGMPSAIVGSVVVFSAPAVSMAVAGTFGVNVLGSVVLVALGLASGYVSLLLLVAALLSSIRVAQTGGAVRTAALWGFRATGTGWKPLASLFALFLSATLVAALVLPAIFDSLFADLYGDDFATAEAIRYWMNWPGLFVALSILLALLVPMVKSLSRAESREALSAEEVRLPSEQRWFRLTSRVLRRCAIALRVLAFGVLCSTPFYGVLQGASGYTLPLLGAFVLWRWAAALDRSAAACANPDAGKWKRLEALWYPFKLAAFFLAVIAIGSLIFAGFLESIWG